MAIVILTTKWLTTLPGKKDMTPTAREGSLTG